MKTPESMTDYLKLTDAQKMELAGLPSVPSNAMLAAAFADFWHAKWPHQTRDVKKLEMSAHYVGCREAFYAGAKAANIPISIKKGVDQHDRRTTLICRTKVKNNMTIPEAKEYGYAVEKYGGGFILVDYSRKRGRFGTAYRGKDGQWRDQPIGIGMMPFSSEEEAWFAIRN